MTTATYTGYCLLGGFDPATGAWVSATEHQIYTVELGDDAADTNPSDGSVGDGQELEGEQLRIVVAGLSYSAQATYVGWTYNGDPILFLPNGNYVIPTNDTTLGTGPGQANGNSTYTYCFGRGTLILTPEGECPAESLNVGNLVITAEGKCVPIKWIGRQARHPLFARINGQLPILIKAGSLGEGLPYRDLYVSPDHALLVDGVLVHALALVNGVSILQATDWPCQNLEYFHIELENHELILAEGVPAETFVDNVSRKNFDNYDEYVDLYGEGTQIPELLLPRVKTKRQVSSRTKMRLMEIAVNGVRSVA